MRGLDVTRDPAELGRYELLFQLGSGGMGTAYLARHAGLGGFQRLCALKRLHPHLADDPRLVEMFLTEARLAARLHHPNVVPIVDVGRDGGSYYLVMEYIEGDTLMGLLEAAGARGELLPLDVVHRIALDALSGLHAAHELTGDDGAPLELVHRDVSPYNIIVGTDGLARLMDFGLARTAQRRALTGPGDVKGNAPFMSPEQVRGAALDRRSDFFSMGSVHWELYTSRRLFAADSFVGTMRAILESSIPAPSGSRPDLPEAFDAIVLRALEHDPRARYPSAAHWARALEAAARDRHCLANHGDVAKFVKGLLGDKHSARRATIDRAMVESASTVVPAQEAKVAPTEPVVRPATQVTEKSRDDGTAAACPGDVRRATVGMRGDVDAGVASRPARTPRSTRSSVRMLALIAGLVMLVASATTAVIFWQRSERTRALAATTPTAPAPSPAAPSAIAAPAPAPEPTRDPVIATAPAPSASTLPSAAARAAPRAPPAFSPRQASGASSATGPSAPRKQAYDPYSHQ